MTVKDKTYMIFRCTKRKYAESFMKDGSIRFGKPAEWIDAYYKEGKGRGDNLECSFAAFEKYDEHWISFCKKSRPDASVIYDKNHKLYFLQSKSVVNMRAFCVFGVQDSSFTSMAEGEDHELYPVMTIGKEYFEAFSDISKEKYATMDEGEKPVLLVINNPHTFFERIRAGLVAQFGLKNEEIWILPVIYKDFTKPFLLITPPPTEVLNKSDEFKYQSEIRIVINTTNNKTIDQLDKNNGIVCMGSLEDICSIEPYYFNDMILERRGNHMLFNLSVPVEEKIDKDFAVGVLCQLLCDEHPSVGIRGAYKEEKLNEITTMLKDKFNMEFNRNTYELHYQDVDGSYYTYMFKDVALKKILHHIDLFMSRKQWAAARDSCLNALEIDKNNTDATEKLSICEAELRKC